MSSAVLRFILLLAVVAIVYLAGNGRTQLFDRDEPRYAQCSRQMLQSGDWVVPRLYDGIRAAKPPGIYWCQATAMKWMGDNAFAARFPSALATVLVALLLGLAVWREVGPRHAIWAAFILSSTLLMLWSGKNSLTDAVLLLCTTVGLGCIYLLWRRRGGWMTVVVLAVAIAGGGLVKGPFILGVLAGTPIMLALLSALDRWLHRRAAIDADEPTSLGSEFAPDEGTEASKTARSTAAPALLPYRSTATAAPLASTPPQAPLGFARIALMSLLGVIIIIAMIGPWVYLVHHRAPEFLGAARADAVHHLESGSEGHAGPPGYHLLLIWLTYLPWSLLLPMTIVLAFKHRRIPQVRYSLAAVLGTWIFVEILQTKLPHYILPAFPALAFLTADALIRCLDGQRKDLVTKLNARVLGSGALVVVLVAVGPWWLAIKFHDYPWLALLSLTAFAILYGGTVSFLFFTRRPRPAAIAMGLGAMGLAVMLFVVYLPSSQPLRLPIRVADVLKANGAIHPRDAVMFEYKEPSLAFYQGGTIREYNASLAQLSQSPNEPRWAVIPQWVWDQSTPQVRSAFDVIAPSIVGWDYSDAGKTAHVMVVRRRD